MAETPAVPPGPPRGRRLGGQLSRVVGFGLSILVLAVAALLIIPAMIEADGQDAWGAIALGQSIGTIAAVLIGWGWSLSGPASIANATPALRRHHVIEALRAKLLLFPLAAIAAGGIAALVAPASPLLAAAGAVSMASIGLTAEWYFVGTSRPYMMFFLETLPRVGGTIVGIVLMKLGQGAFVGLLSMLGGMLVAFAVVTVWLLSTLPSDGMPDRRPLGAVLHGQRHGLVSSVGSAVYAAGPIVIVSLLTPAIQPTFALADKLQRQVSVALGPITSVFQGWVPKGDPRGLPRRVRLALLVAGVLSIVVGAGTAIFTPWLITVLGADAISVTLGIVLLMSLFVAVRFFESVVVRATLSALGELKLAARMTLISALVGFPLVAVGAIFYGVVGALAGSVLGLLVRLSVELIVALRGSRGDGAEASVA